MKNVIFDLDDFAEPEERNCLDALISLKEKFPNLKVTLFSIPFYNKNSQRDFLVDVSNKYPWIELAVHGWEHDSNFECATWDLRTAIKNINRAIHYGCFVKGFKAPGWQISRDTYQACKNLGVWVADHKVSAYTEPGILNKERRPLGLPIYEIDHEWMLHGHTWNCVGNGIYELVEKWEEEGYPFNKDTKFHFVSEII